jgi:hypothetical protein
MTPKYSADTASYPYPVNRLTRYVGLGVLHKHGGTLPRTRQEIASFESERFWALIQHVSYKQPEDMLPRLPGVENGGGEQARLDAASLAAGVRE